MAIGDDRTVHAHDRAYDRAHDRAHDVVVRASTLDDLPTVASWVTDQEQLTRWIGPRFTFPLDASDLPGQFDWSTGESWTAVIDDDVTAFGQLHARGSDRQHLARIITAPDRRGQGIGAVLVRHLVHRSRDLGASVVSLNVRPDNDGAARFYRRLGFVDAVRPAEDRPLPSTYLEWRWDPG